MNSQILANINNFIKNRLIELFGILLILMGISLFVVLLTYSPSDPNFIYNTESSEIKNAGGFYGSVISDFILQSFGLVSFLLCINFFIWGYKIITKNNKSYLKLTDRIFYAFCYVVFGTTVLNIFYNDSYWLIHNGNGGFIGRIIKENLFNFFPLLENQYVNYVLILLTIIFFYFKFKYKN